MCTALGSAREVHVAPRQRCQAPVPAVPGGCRGVYASVRALPDPPPGDVANAETRYIRALCADIGQINAVSMQTFAIRIDAGRGRSGVHPNQSIHGEWSAVSGPRYHEVRRENEAYEAAQRAKGKLKTHGYCQPCTTQCSRGA